MRTQIKERVDRRRRDIAASYRKQGYQVTVPSTPDSLPEFLHDCHPDLIAVRDDDRAVITIKPTTALKGSNDLVEMAERVARQPGWRLELATVRAEPDYTGFLAPEWLDQAMRSPYPEADTARECIYRMEVVACVLRGIASAANVWVRGKTTKQLAGELTTLGLIDQDQCDRIDDALDWQARTMLVTPGNGPTDGKAAELEQLCRDMIATSQYTED